MKFKEILEDLTEFLASHFHYILLISLIILIIGVVFIYLNVTREPPPITPIDPHMRP